LGSVSLRRQPLYSWNVSMYRHITNFLCTPNKD
jgi:hypothetical protein